MKMNFPSVKNSLLLGLVLAGCVLRAQTHTISDPIAYNDYIVGQQDRIGTELLKLMGMFDALPEDEQVCMDQLEVVISTCKSAIANVQNLVVIAHEFGLKQSAIELFEFYARIMDTEYRKVIDQLYAPQPDLKLMQSILVDVQDQEAKVDEKFQHAQTSFAAYHHVSLEENKLQKEFDEAGE